MKPGKKVIHVLSGGMDSTTLLYYLIAQGYNVVGAVTYQYGQRHSREVSMAKETIKYVNDKLNILIPHKIIDISAIGQLATKSALTGDVDVPHGHYEAENMKLTVVPNRNMSFISLAAIWAVTEQASLSIGVHAGDHCFSKNTKILTPSGLKTVKDLSVGSELYSFDVTRNIWQLDSVVDIIEKNRISTINFIKTYAGGIELTDEHSVYRLKLSNFHAVHGYTKTIEKVKVKDLVEGDYLVQPTSLQGIDKIVDTIDLLPIAEKLVIKYENGLSLRNENGYMWLGGDSSKYKANKIPQEVNAEAFVNLMAWYIAEGCSQKDPYTVQGSFSRYSASFYQSLRKNLANVEIILRDFEKCGLTCKYEFSKVFHNDLPKDVTFYVSNITAMFMKECGSHSAVKEIPDWLFDILLQSCKLRDSFLYTLTLADGFAPSIKGQGFCSISEKLIEQVTTLLQLSGYHFSIQQSQGKTKYVIYSKLGTRQALISLGEAKFTQVISITPRQYNDYVYDISVEKNHNFIAGDLGSLLISNSIYPDCRESFIKQAEQSIRIGNWEAENFQILNLFQEMSKGDIVKVGLSAADSLGIGYTEIYIRTHTCYEGTDPACGKCGACQERLEAFEFAGVQDPINYKNL